MAELQIACFNCPQSDFDDPVRGRPFANNQRHILVTDRLDEADYIHCRLGRERCNEAYETIAATAEFRDHASKFVFFSNHDQPVFAYRDQQSVKVLAQPMRPDTRTHNIIVAPLQMHDFEWALIQDTDFIQACRRAEKREDLVFVGQGGYGGRDKIMNRVYPGLTTNFRVTKPIWHIQDVQRRLDLMRPFLMELARARFCFCPRGMGSSSFRLYQSLMVGTVPIVSGHVALPFTDQLDYSRFCLFHGVDDPVETFLEQIQACDYQTMRTSGVRAWERFFHMKKTDQLLFEVLVERLSSSTPRE